MGHKLLLQMLKAPFSTGAAVPSSRFLAAEMVRAAGAASHVVELGAGTGPVTHQILKRWTPAAVVVVELQASLAKHLARRFPHADIRQATAQAVLDALQYRAPVSVISSLPFRSLPQAVREATIESICSFLKRHPGSQLVQFTYQPREPFVAPAGFAWQRTAWVWRNVPPAGVWVLRSVSV